MKNILHYIVTHIVEKSDEVIITEEENQGIVNLIIKVANEDMGKIIGKEGKVIRAMRNLMRIPGVLQGKKIYITIAES